MSADEEREDESGISEFQDAAELLADFDKIFEISDKVEKANATTYTITMEPPSRVLARHGEWRMHTSVAAKDKKRSRRGTKSVQTGGKVGNSGGRSGLIVNSGQDQNKLRGKIENPTTGKEREDATTHESGKVERSSETVASENRSPKRKTEDGQKFGTSTTESTPTAFNTKQSSPPTIAREVQKLYSKLDIDNGCIPQRSSGHDFEKVLREQVWRSRQEMSWPTSLPKSTYEQSDRSVTSQDARIPTKTAINATEFVRNILLEEQRHVDSPMLNTKSQHFVNVTSEKLAKKNTNVKPKQATVIQVKPITRIEAIENEEFCKEEVGGAVVESPRPEDASADKSNVTPVIKSPKKKKSFKQLLSTISRVFTGCWRKETKDQ